MSREEISAEAQREFDGLDYNNQRNLLLFVRSEAVYCREDNQHDRYTNKKAA